MGSGLRLGWYGVRLFGLGSEVMFRIRTSPQVGACAGVQWRIVPEGFGTTRRFWYCENNIDPSHNKCSVPQQPDDAVADFSGLVEPASEEGGAAVVPSAAAPSLPLSTVEATKVVLSAPKRSGAKRTREEGRSAPRRRSPSSVSSGNGPKALQAPKTLSDAAAAAAAATVAAAASTPPTASLDVSRDSTAPPSLTSYQPMCGSHQPLLACVMMPAAQTSRGGGSSERDTFLLAPSANGSLPGRLQLDVPEAAEEEETIPPPPSHLTPASPMDPNAPHAAYALEEAHHQMGHQISPTTSLLHMPSLASLPASAGYVLVPQSFGQQMSGGPHAVWAGNGLQPSSMAPSSVPMAISHMPHHISQLTNSMGPSAMAPVPARALQWSLQVNPVQRVQLATISPAQLPAPPQTAQSAGPHQQLVVATSTGLSSQKFSSSLLPASMQDGFHSLPSEVTAAEP